jgi:predicted molibdopterin-dependent oxidoreductase YjgC
MFRLLDDFAERVVITLDGAEVSVPAGVSVAAALLHLGRIPVRGTAVSGAPRAPFCMMGVCFDCLVEIDGVANQRGCQRQVEAGMTVRRQLTIGEAGQ